MKNLVLLISLLAISHLAHAASYSCPLISNKGERSLISFSPGSNSVQLGAKGNFTLQRASKSDDAVMGYDSRGNSIAIGMCLFAGSNSDCRYMAAIQLNIKNPAVSGGWESILFDRVGSCQLSRPSGILDI